MDVLGEFFRKFVIDNCLYLFDVQSSCCEVSCQEVLILVFLEIKECLNTLCLTEVSMQFAGFQSQQTKNDGHPVTLSFGLEEHDHSFLVQIFEDREESGLSVFFCVLA